METHQLRKYVVISGADRGLGRAFAREFGSRGYHLILQVHGDRGFTSYSDELASKYGISVKLYNKDLKEEENIFGFVEWVSSLNLPLAGLVTFSGGNGSSKFEEIDIDHLERVLLVNLRAMTLLNRLFLTEFQKHPSPFILNISNAENHKADGQLIYTASKTFVYSLTVGLGEELKNSTQVSLLWPGMLQVSGENGQSYHRLNFFAEIGVDELLAGRRVIRPGFYLKIKLRISKVIKNWFAPRSSSLSVPVEKKVSLREELVEKEQEK
jgi:uncharacterized protein